jgi:DNA gyrase inhibitor GyrI
MVKLEPMRVASAHAYSASPEGDAWDKLVAWAGPKGLLEDRASHRIFGFDNPSPSPGSPNYGYEFWIEVGPEVEGEGEIKIKAFSGGRYAVTRCVGVPQIGETWKRLNTWIEDSSYQHGRHQWLEQNLSPGEAVPEEELVLDLCYPVR